MSSPGSAPASALPHDVGGGGDGPHGVAAATSPEVAADLAVVTDTIGRIAPLDAGAMGAADQRQGTLTKPPGSMGRLETLGRQLAGIAGVCPPPVPAQPRVFVLAADHGVHAQGVSPWPQEVTRQMVANVVAGGAVVTVLARQVGATVTCVDLGVAGGPVEVTTGACGLAGKGTGTPVVQVPDDGPGVSARGTGTPTPVGLVEARLGAGTADLALGPAMSQEQALRALRIGIDLAAELGSDLVVTGDLGIANTTASAALVAAFTGRPAEEVTGAGAGSGPDMLAHKTTVVDTAVRRHLAGPDASDPLATLAALGGFEHAALTGLVLGAAARRVPVLLDGVIAGAAALAARALAPGCAAYLVAGHRSAEPGATAALLALGLDPLLDLDLRLGEGSGAVLAVPLVQAAARLLGEVATFDSAGVSGTD